MFELLCYTAVTIAILWLRGEQLTRATVSQPVIEPIAVIELPVTPKYKRAAKSVTLASCIIPVAIAPVLPDGWNLDKNGNPLRGAALKHRKRKYGIE